MKNCILASLFVFFVLCTAPLITLTFKESATESESLSITSQTEEADTVRVLQTSSGNVLNISTTEYLIGAVASEMPASFNEEALKAQAVACYTYLRWIMKNADNSQKAISDISDDSDTHQGYMNKSDMEERWGKKYTTYYQKIKSAVTSVQSEYISYENEPINAAFHGLSHGKTNNSEDIWNTSIPYLISVEAPGDKLSSDLVSELSFTKDEIINALNMNEQDEEKGKFASVTKSTEDGFVKTLKIGSKSFTATDIRSALSLKSPNFTVKESDNKIFFTVYGKGHGLGMSQYSADFMARQGADYKEILTHFYPGTKIVKD